MIHKIKGLHDDGCGLSIRAISQELGISRNTVRKYLRADEVAIATASWTARGRSGWTSTGTTSSTCWGRFRS